MTPVDTARELRARAHALGFDAVGIASAQRLDRDGAALQAWLGDDMHAAMAWMARDPERRADPRELLQGCRSVVVVAMNYGPAAEPQETRAGKVALYARGRDYHKVLRRKLRALAAWLEANTDARASVQVDTGPVLERGWAERSGVGWIGKNANLLTRGFGSWVLLGEILTTAELPADPGPHADHCGSCSACIDACPTSAIVAPGVVDSRLCISNWTIEHRGPIPLERRAGIGDWMFGCDDCQTSCPWNESFARPTEGNPFERREDLSALDPEEILGLTEAEFRRRYSGTSLMRAKWEGLRRNACIVLGNRREKHALPALRAALRDPGAVIRSHAAWALGRIGGADAVASLEAALTFESDPRAFDELISALEVARRHRE